MEIFETFGNLRTDADQLLHSGTVGHSLLDMLENHSFAGSHNHLDISGVATVDYIFLCQQVSGGNDGRSQFMKCDNAIPEFIATF